MVHTKWYVCNILELKKIVLHHIFCGYSLSYQSKYGLTMLHTNWYAFPLPTQKPMYTTRKTLSLATLLFSLVGSDRAKTAPVEASIYLSLSGKLQTLHSQTPDKFMAVGAAALQIWAMVANELMALDREAIATRVRGGAFKDTVFGDVEYAANGQMQSRKHASKVQDDRIVVQKCPSPGAPLGQWPATMSWRQTS